MGAFAPRWSPDFALTPCSSPIPSSLPPDRPPLNHSTAFTSFTPLIKEVVR